MTKTMKTMLLSTAMIAVLASGAGAQTATNTNTSTSNSTSGSTSNSGAASTASNRGNTQGQNITFNTPPAANTHYGNNQNNGDVTVRTTPQVYAPPVSGGNPCTLAVSGGVSVIGWGASAGGTFVDEDCATRQKIAMVHNAGYHAAARELMCNDRRTYDAFKVAGQACAFRPDYEPKGAQPMPVPVVVPTMPAPTSPPMVQMAAPKVYPRCNARLGINDNCRS